MALEALLPSEVARLVYGYLIDEKCTETAKLFLKESSNLQECRSVLSYGRNFTTRVCGYALLDILEKFCIINSLIQDKINGLDNLNKLKYCNNVIDQIKLILDEYNCQRDKNNVDTFTQDLAEISADSQQAVQTSNEDFQMQIQTNLHPNNIAVEATLVTNLPGYINNVKADKFETYTTSPHKTKKSIEADNIPKKLDDIILKSQISNENVNIISTQLCGELKDCINDSSIESLKSQNLAQNTINTLSKTTMTDAVDEKLINYKNSEMQASDVESIDSEILQPDECVEIIGDITIELLNRTEMQERIAENINRILQPIKSNLDKKYVEETKNKTDKSFVIEFDKAVEAVVNKTENDPEILQLLDEVIPLYEEIVNMESEVDNDIENVNEFEENIDTSLEKNSQERKNNMPETNVQNISKTLENENVNKNINLKDIAGSLNPTPAEQVAINKNADNVVTRKTIHQIGFSNHNSYLSNSEMLDNIKNNSKDLLDPLESPILQNKSANKMDNNFFTHNNTLTSTPLKTFKAVQNFDTCDWFSTQELCMPVIPLKTNYTYVHTACETVVTTTMPSLSPVIPKESKIDKTVTNNSFRNTVNDQTLNTPEIVSLSKSKIPNNRSNLSVVIPKNKTQLLEKNSGILDESLTVQKSGSTGNISSFLKNNSEYNRYFSIESIMLCGMDNSTSLLQTPLNIPDIGVADATLTGTGLSPFLKLNKKSDRSNIKNKSKDDKIIDSAISIKAVELNSISENDKEIFQQIGDSKIEIKHTPEKVLENPTKHNRLSLSTPRKPSNYKRVLNFDLPMNRSFSENNLKDKRMIYDSPKTVKMNLKKSLKSPSFKSSYTNSEIIHKKYSDISQDFISGTDQSVMKIIDIKATNLQEGTEIRNSWDRKHRIIFNSTDVDINGKSQKFNCNEVTVQSDTSKNSWKKIASEKIQKKVINSSLTTIKQSENPDKTNDKKNEDTKNNITVHKRTEIIVPRTAKESLEMLLSDSFNNKEIIDEEDIVKMAVEEMNDLIKFDKNEPIIHNNEKSITGKEQIISTSIPSTESKLLTNSITVNNSTQEQNITIEQNTSYNNNVVDYEKIEEQLSIITNTEIPRMSIPKADIIYDQVSKLEQGKIVHKKYARLKTLDTKLAKSIDKQPLSSFGFELDSPSKCENTIQFPPTPRILSPGSSSLSMLMTKQSEDSRTIQSLVATPIECPSTPKIVLTPPKTVHENTNETISKCDTKSFGNSAFTVFKSSENPEITQFEVIKENLLKEKPPKQFLLNSEKLVDNVLKLDTSMSYRVKEISSKSENSSSSCSSTCSCNSCSSSSSSDDDTNTPDSIIENNVTESPKTKNIVENSPGKNLSVNKIENNTDDSVKKIADKDENLCIKTNICDAPNIAKKSETPKDFNTKISNIISKEQEAIKEQNNCSTLKIISIEHAIPKVVIKPMTKLMKTLSPNLQMKAIELKNEINKAVTDKKLKIVKSEEEVAMAVESIIDDGKANFKVSQEAIDKSLNGSVLSPMNKTDSSINDSGKIELIKAVASIMDISTENAVENTSTEKEYPISKSSTFFNVELSSKNTNASSDKTVNRRNETKKQQELSSHPHNTRYQSQKLDNESFKKLLNESKVLKNNDIPCTEFVHVFDELNHKRTRRKAFRNDDLITLFRDPDGESVLKLRSTDFEILYEVTPARKKYTKKSVSKKMVDENSQGLSSMNSNANTVNSENTIDTKEINKRSIKRKITAKDKEEVPKKIARKKGYLSVLK